jgi:hypothetical protein
MTDKHFTHTLDRGEHAFTVEFVDDDPGPEGEPRFYATIHMHDAAYVPRGRRVAVKGYLRIAFERRSWGERYSYDGGYLSRAPIDDTPSFMLPDLPEGYAGALVEDFGPELYEVFTANRAEIAQKARNVKAARWEEKADDLAAWAERLRTEANRARAGADDLKTDAQLERGY